MSGAYVTIGEVSIKGNFDECTVLCVPLTQTPVITL